MPYTILDPASTDATARSRRASQCALAVMAKAPRPGKVKTRLCPPLTLEQSAALNICFLRDTAENLSRVSSSSPAAGLVCYTPVGEESLFEGILPASFLLIPQGDGNFGERLYGAAHDILACGFASVCLIDSDSPTVPASVYAHAVAELSRPGDRVVLGGSDDGGYYLIGLKQPHRAPFEGIHWSTSSVFAETVAATEAAGIEVVQLPLWYDVDDGATLHTLSAELLAGQAPAFAPVAGYAAEHSRAFLMNLHSLASAV